VGRLVGLWVGALGLLGCGADGSPPPHLVVVVVDTLRADHLGAYGYPRPTSPHFDQLAEGGTVFENARAPSSWTKPSVGSLFTSRWPSEHGAVSFAQQLAAELPTLAELLAGAGYRTVGVSANFVHVSEVTGFARGFESFEALPVALEDDESGDLLGRAFGERSGVRLRAPHGPEVNQAVARMLGASDPRPLFLYVHYMEPHAPYAPPEDLRDVFSRDRGGAKLATSDEVVDLARARTSLPARQQRWLVDLYDAEIAAADRALGELVAWLAEQGYWKDTVLAVVSDHGEELSDHGGWFHGLTLHDEVLRVPFLLHDARAQQGSRRRDAVDLLDVPTTLLALARVSPAPGMEGRALLAAGELVARDSIGELHPDPPFEERVGPRLHRVALLRWPWKGILDREGGLATYRLDRDPHESKPIELEGMQAPAGFQASIFARRGDPGAPARSSPTLPPDEREGLRALGYVQ
jgi:arylsulfatase A-like enzyme